MSVFIKYPVLLSFIENRYNRSIQASNNEDDDDDKTTAPSIVMSTDLDSENDIGRYDRRKKRASNANASSLPEKYVTLILV